MSTVEAPIPAAAVEKLAELNRLEETADIAQALERAAQVAMELIPEAMGVSITVHQEGHDFTFGSSEELMQTLDQHEYDTGEGACLDSLRTNEVVSSSDVAGETRWPGWTRLLIDSRVCSVMGMPLTTTSELPGVLNLYGKSIGAFDSAESKAVVAALAAHVSVLLSNLSLYGTSKRLSGQLQEAMESRAVIEQAKGVLMAMLASDADTAFQYLVKLSQRRNEKLRSVAVRVVSDASSGRAAKPLAES